MNEYNVNHSRRCIQGLSHCIKKCEHKNFQLIFSILETNLMET